MASTDPAVSAKTWSSSSDIDSNPNDDAQPVTFADLGVRRNTEVVETYFGKRRILSSLSRKEWGFAILSILSILGAAGLTIERLVKLSKNSADFTFALILLLTLGFCLFYVINGLIGERPYELLIFIIGTLILMIYCIYNYIQTINTDNKDYTQRDKNIKLARLIIIVAVGPFNIILGGIIAREHYLSRNLIFRTVGANIELQDLCSRMFFTESLFKIDLQLELTLVILILKDGVGSLDAVQITVLVVGVVYAAIWFALGLLSMNKESKILVYIIFASSWCEPAYIIYILVNMGMSWSDFSDLMLIPAAIIIASFIGLVIRFAVCGFMFYVFQNFGRGMREKAYGIVKNDTSTPPNTVDSC